MVVERLYRLDPELESTGRSLMNNLVIGYHTVPLKNIEGFKELPQSKLHPNPRFSYLDNTEIFVLPANVLEIQSADEESFREAESKIKEICATKGVPIVNLS